ncbi:MAG TPA: hypothetical protein DDW17_01105 [Deltaproteobacteria bacterium]|nr:hypothetical protein [Deltaproteobacteria bacterium]
MKRKAHRILTTHYGFTLIELIIVMALVLIVFVMSTDTFSILIRHSRQQSQIVVAEFEGIVGLEMLRADIEQAGFGLPWAFQGAINYQEAQDSPEKDYNDSPSNPPRAILSGNNVVHTCNGSDYLVIKSTVTARNATSEKWSYIVKNDMAANAQPHEWGIKDFETNERIIAIKPSVGESRITQLIMDGANFYTSYAAAGAYPQVFAPQKLTEMFLLYGIAPSSISTLRMPFNRSDYYIRRPATGMPSTCAPGTGILYKATLNHADGKLNEMPLIDCVADMQVIFRLDTDGNGAIDNQTDDISALTAQQIREQVKEVRVYVLLHEGQYDKTYVSSLPNPLPIGEFVLGNDFNFNSRIGSTWKGYRWKVHTIVVKPRNLFR